MHVVLKEARILQTILDLFLDLLFLFIVFLKLSMFPNESSPKCNLSIFNLKFDYVILWETVVNV